MGPGHGAEKPRWQLPGVFTQLNVPKYFCHQCLYPQGELQPLSPTSSEDSARPASRSGPSFHHIMAFALGPGACEILCVPFRSEVSVSPNPVWLLQLSPAGLQRQMLWAQLPSA